MALKALKRHPEDGFLEPQQKGKYHNIRRAYLGYKKG